MQAALYRYLGAEAAGLAPHPHEIACFFTPDGALSELLATRRDPVLSLGLILQAGWPLCIVGTQIHGSGLMSRGMRPLASRPR